ncbi:MAG: murein L,D-transpeptidase family protein [Bacteroidales bacterium]
MSRLFKRIIFFSIVLALLSGVFFLIIYLTPKPPIGEVEYALASLELASQSKAQNYSKELYRSAKKDYDSAMANWQRQNKRFILFRDYSKVKDFAKKSAEKANKASHNSKNLSKNLIITIKEKIDSLNNLISNTNQLFNQLPLSDDIRDKISKGRLLLRESELDFEKGEYLKANSKIEIAEENLLSSYNFIFKDVKEYFNSHPYWGKIVNAAISNSKRNQSSTIIIDKFARKLYVYQSGAKKLEYSVEFGKNWIGRKRLKGDKATPEGVYLVKSKVPSNKTKYFRALLLNYPNADDIERFKQDKESGKIPHNALIGNLIEIHGNGGKGTDWTDGCIALCDSDMLKVYNLIQVGTPVVIVGSIEDFDTIANNFNLKRISISS